MVASSGRTSISIEMPRRSRGRVSLSRFRRDLDTSDDDEEDGKIMYTKPPKKLECGWLPCCMTPEDAESFGHHVSIFMVALVAFATFFCVTFILVLVFILG